MTRNPGVRSSVPCTALQTITNLSVTPGGSLAGFSVARPVTQATTRPVGAQSHDASMTHPGGLTSPHVTHRLKIWPFLMGLASSATGIAIILAIALSLLQLRWITGDFTILVLSLLTVFGVLLIGTGFGMMVLSSGGFDQPEFDRLSETGDTYSAEMPHVSLAKQVELEMPEQQTLRENDSASNTATATGMYRNV